MTKIFTGGLLTETNTFAPYPTGMATFQEAMFMKRGEGINPSDDGDICKPFIDGAQALGWEVATGLRAFAQPAGRVVQSCYEELRDELLDDLKAAMPVDAVFLSLHGAMIAEQEFDGEGDIIERTRNIVGPKVPIGVHIDPHCHLTRKMVDNADVIKIWKEYPHIDVAERATEVFHLIKAQLEGAPRPIPVVYDCRMTQMFHTTREPMRSFVDKIIALEGKDGIQTVSIAHSFPWGDMPDMGTKVLVYADDEASLPKAKALAEALGKELWDIKEVAGIPFLTIDETLDKAYSTNQIPVVISDGSDNPGGGAPCDSTYFLARLVERSDKDWAVGYMFDPMTVRIAIEAGVGASLRMRIGGKICELSGDPIDADVKVTGIIRNAQMRFGTISSPAGDAVALDLGDNRHIVAINLRTQTYSPNLFVELGVDLASKRAVVVKSSQHFHAGFSSIAGDILYAAAPGVVTPDLKSLPYKYADTTLWPLINYKEAAKA